MRAGRQTQMATLKPARTELAFLEGRARSWQQFVCWDENSILTAAGITSEFLARWLRQCR